MEIWKDVKGYEGIYQVSIAGSVRRVLKNGFRDLKPISHSGGYLRVKLRNKGNDKDAYIHRLVAEAFIPNPHNLKEVNHISGDKENNFIDNLEWCNRRENCSHNSKMRNTSSKYVGVHYDKKMKKFKSRIFIDGERRDLGFYRTELGAYLAYVSESERLGISNKYI
jgi:hypothetical protein